MVFLGTNSVAPTGESPVGSIVLQIGLISLLVILAAVGLLFTGRYPRGIYDAVVGLNRWVIGSWLT